MKKLIVTISAIAVMAWSLPAWGQKVNQATIRGELIKVGQGADIVQSRIRADKFTGGHRYGDISKGYYNDGEFTYIITYGPPKNNTWTYVVRQIEKVPGKARQSVTIGTLADTVLERRGKAIAVKPIGRDENGLLVEWEYPDMTYLMGRRAQGGIEAYRVIKITPRKSW